MTRVPNIRFHKDGEHPVQKNEITSKMNFLRGVRDWRVLADLRTTLKYPVLLIQKTYALVLYRGVIQRLCPPTRINDTIVRRKEAGARAKEETATSLCDRTTWKRYRPVMSYILRSVAVD